MEDLVGTLTIFLRLSNLIVAVYLVWLVLSTYRKSPHGSFSKTLKVMAFAILLFFAVEFAQLFEMIPGWMFETMQSVFAFVFLLLLIYVVEELRMGMRAHDHLVKRKHRARLLDVE